ncbi:matrix extracellular phosphoglycoprotein [Gracilinanus agilis]|uniref:matrix extracellular phosphoglycoprotein n=1 Tax=Gracilinanus agilis TaxID=191870 RepID=UPI001CFECE56|nr:matrix extracellular phosphoglycoprotein [Gracilinanus agilis]
MVTIPDFLLQLKHSYPPLYFNSHKEGNVPVHHFNKENKQEISPKGNVIQEKEKSQDISAGKKILNKDEGTQTSKSSHRDFEVAIYTRFNGNANTGHGRSVSKELPNQEVRGVILINKNVQHDRKYASAKRLWLIEKGEEDNKTENSTHNKPETTKFSETQGKRDKDITNNQRGIQNQNIPGDHTANSHGQYATEYSKLSLKHIKFPYDFEGSGQEEEDNDFSLSGGGMIDPDTETTSGYTSVPDPDKNNAIKSNSKFPIGNESNNEIPEKEHDLNSSGGNSTRDIVGTDVNKTPREEKNIIDNKILGGSNYIKGSTNYRKLPGKEGDDFDANTGNAHQGSGGFHHSQQSSEKQRIIGQHASKGSNDVIKGMDYNEISKHGQDKTKASVGSSKRDQKTKNDKENSLSEGKGQSLIIPSYSHTYPSKGANDIRKKHYATHTKFSSTKSHHVSGRKRFWGPKNAHSKKFKPTKRNDSSDSTSSDHSSDSDSDQSMEYFQGGAN